MDNFDERRKALFHELRQLMQKVHRVNVELGYLDRGQLPPERQDESYIPPFLRAQKPTVTSFRRRRVA